MSKRYSCRAPRGRHQRLLGRRQADARWRGHVPLPGYAQYDEAACDESAALARCFAERASAEYASVSAFLQLAEQLRDVAAPASLVARALAAADDELDHAVATGAANVRFAASPLLLSGGDTNTRLPAQGPAGLVRLAIESWLDGVLVEGWAAAVAREEQRATPDPQLASLLSRIAADEQRHAELAWDVLRWALRTGGGEVRRALEAARHARVTGEDARCAGDGSALVSRLGLLDAPARARVLDQVRARAPEQSLRGLARELA